MADRRTSGVLVAVSAVVLVLVAACSGGTTSASDEPGLGSRIEAAVDPYVAADDPVRAVLAMVDGEVVYEQYFHSSRDEYRSVFSVTKSVMSALIGIAIEDGSISGVDATLGELLPEYSADMTPQVSRITLRQILTMTAGFPDYRMDWGWDPMTEQEPIGASLSDSIMAPAGRKFAYSDVGAHLTSPILERATGMEVVEFAHRRLFEPLGVPSDPAGPSPVLPDDDVPLTGNDFVWPVDRDGYNIGYGELQLRPVDMARMGQLYLQDGDWGGKQVVPAAWVRESTQDQVPDMDVAASESYGYLWWTDRHGGSAYRAVGMGGQRVDVVPEQDLVIVISTEVDPVDLADSGITDTHATQISDAVLTAVRED